MKIAVNTRLLLPKGLLGIGRYIYETTKRLVEQHPEDEFHFFFDRPYDERFIFGDNVTAHILNPPARHPILWYLWFEVAVAKKLKSLNVDVFYSGDMYMSLRSSTPTILVSHDLGYEHYPHHVPWLARKYYQHYFPKYHQACTQLIAVSEATKQDIIDIYKVPADKITVAGNAVPEGFKPLAVAEKEKTRTAFTKGLPYFVFVGSLHPRKNLKNLLLAFNLFKEKTNAPHQLVIYGEVFFKTGEMKKVYEAMSHKNSVIFLNQNDTDVPTITGAATASCYVSLFEGFGIPILEAFASEVPVITSDCSSMPEVAGDAALIVNPHDLSEIATAMTKVIQEKELIKSLTAKGLQRVTNYSWEETSRIIYQQLKVARIS